MTYVDVLSDEFVVDKYRKIDKENPFPFNHGLKHIINVCNLMNRLGAILEIDKEQLDALLIACALHDIGQFEGRIDHGKKSRKFISNYYEEKLKDNKYYNDILNAVQFHDNDANIEEPMFWTLVKVCDKMDFSKDRLEDNYRDKYRYYCYEDINSIEFIYDDEFFGINIITGDVDDFKTMFLNERFSTKVFNCLDILATKLNRTLVVKHNGEEFSYARNSVLEKKKEV